MARSNKERVGDALDSFVWGVRRFVIDQMKAKYGEKEGPERAQKYVDDRAKPGQKTAESPEQWDVLNVCNVINAEWQYLFRYQLGKAERGMLSEIEVARNNWAHQQGFSMDDTIRALDTIHRILQATGASDESDDVDKIKNETMRQRFQDVKRLAVDRAGRRATEGTPQTGLRPWREVMQPHQDVCEGNFQNAEFAADLAQVHRGGGSEEYRDPVQFFRRTYLTAGLNDLLNNAFRRLNGKGGHPVVELQTNFGGGKTHSMLALYHLCSGKDVHVLPGVDTLMEEHELGELPANIARCVLVGTALSASQPEKTKDGLELRTLWGRLAYQLGGKDVYEMVRQSDENGGSPGSDDLVRIFEKVGPCLILIDEWVAYCRDMFQVDRMPGGTFDSNLKFAQSLTEAVKACPQALLVASLPQSQVEVGGEGGQEALAILRNTFGRIEFNWRTATAEESYDIVKRRLFEPIMEPSKFAERDAVVDAFGNLYNLHSTEFPSECRDGEYRHKLETAYPIHPELFTRLYEDWSSLEEFQRTRGVLRLMASVIHSLWVRNDQSLMIMPGLLPLEDDVQTELTRYLPPNSRVIIEQDVDGPNSRPTALDKESKRYGQVWATRRVARSIYLGSAPVEGQANKGLDIRHVRLGCVQPGENIAVFADALRDLGERASYLYADGARYWYSSQPNVNAQARDRAAELLRRDEDLVEGLIPRLRDEQKRSGGFPKICPCPDSSADVADELDVRLVILPPSATHTNGNEQSPAMKMALSIFETRATSPRQHRNTLVFLAPDEVKLNDLKNAEASYLAWKSIYDESHTLGLDPFNHELAQRRTEETNTTVQKRIPETYQWMIHPTQSAPTDPIGWEAVRLTSGDSLCERAFKRLERDGLLTATYAGSLLRQALERYLWNDQDHLDVRLLTEYFSNYLYLQRVTCPDVILKAIEDGVASTTWNSDGFAYASDWDDDAKRYVGIKAGTMGGSIVADGKSVVIRPEVAIKQLEAEVPSTSSGSSATGNIIQEEPTAGTDAPYGGAGGSTAPPPVPRLPNTYFASVALNPTKAGLEFSDIMQEVVQHFTKNPSTSVTLKVEIEAENAHGFDETIQRTVKENGNSLSFDQGGFTDG